MVDDLRNASRGRDPSRHSRRNGDTILLSILATSTEEEPRLRVSSTGTKLVAVAEVWNAIGAIASAMKGNVSGSQVALLAAPYIGGMQLSNIAMGAHSRRQ
ncbi:hypothetical protein MPL3356_370007 [Mesorhizobium plurifarium]|uniref:Uncharacterized protein n=1 Tax=Mesorhizobium plurifarium TaxID=69974 RepID=A0A090DWQ6_MESPL|nr:hypothetical protein MPL3356_370007 [Mesorhizobium plurifarium]CDX22382.1 hypothetical protein MPLB_2340004 [Mesorhizobium sp. ORS 3324]CDX37520.1 hypothetical protein MPLA_2060007 [Mesorhizobium sp. ORS 3359]